MNDKQKNDDLQEAVATNELNKLQRLAQERGLDKLTDEEIEEEIQAVRDRKNR